MAVMVGGLILFATQAKASILQLVGKTEIVSIEVNEIPGLSKQEALEIIGIDPGSTFSPSDISRAVKLLYSSGLLSNVRVFASIVGKGKIRLRFELMPQIIINSIRFVGNTAIDSTRLRSVVKLKEGGAYNERMAERMIREIIYEYLEEGFPDVQVRLDRHQLPNRNQINLTYLIAEGRHTKLSSVHIYGKTIIGKRKIRKILNLHIGDELSIVKIREGLDRLRNYYFDRGWYSAQIDFEGPNGMSGREMDRQIPIKKWRKWDLLQRGILKIHIVPGNRILFRFIGNRYVKKHELYDVIRFDSKTYLALTNSVINDLEEKILFYYQSLGYMYAKVSHYRLKDEKHGITYIVFRIREGKRVKISKVVFVGNKHIPAEKLRYQIEAKLFEEINSPDPSQLSSPDPGTIDIPAYPFELIARWEYPHLARYRKFHRSADPEFYRAYIPELYTKVLPEYIKLYYATNGFMRAVVSKPKLRFDKTGMRLTVEYDIKEGIQTIISEIRVIGTHVIPSTKILNELSLATGNPLNIFSYRKMKRKLKKLYRQIGYYYSTCTIEDRISSDYKKAILILHINEGPQVKVGQILVRGNRKTKDAVVLDRLTFTIGDVITPQEERDSEDLLMALGVFQAVNIKFMNQETPDEWKTIIVEVLERPSGEIDVGIGISTNDGIRTKFNIIYRNLFGVALEAHLRSKLNRKIPFFLDDQFASVYDDLSPYDALERNIVLGLRYPSIYGVPFRLGVGVDFNHLRLQERAYGMDKNSIIFYVDTEFGKRMLIMSALTELSFLDLQLTHLPLLAGEEITEPEGKSLEFSPQININVNLCDDIFIPTKGLRFNINTSYVRDIALDLDTSLIRTRFSLSGYIPIYVPLLFWNTRPFVIKLHGRIGYIFNLIQAPVSDDKRFYLGGRLSLRGWPEQSVYPADLTADQVTLIKKDDMPSPGGLSFLLFKAELRIPVYKAYSVGVFYDTAQLWLTPQNMNLDLGQYLSAAGIGIHYATPVGEINFDIGFPIQADDRFPTSGWSTHFSIGLF